MSHDHSAVWIHRGFEAFSLGQCNHGGDNLYVNAAGEIEMIHRFDVNQDGHVDLVLPNSHGYIERGPTWIYSRKGSGRNGGTTYRDPGMWDRVELPNDSSWMSRVVDVDGDGYPDLVVVNGENGVTSELDSYIYWGGPEGLTGQRIELPTAGAYDVASVDLTGNGLQDIILPSAWVDHHNPGCPRRMHVYLQETPRCFTDASARFDLAGIAATCLACADLTGDGHPDLIVGNYRDGFDYDTDSFVYRGIAGGFDTGSPMRLPSHYAMQVLAGDLNGDGCPEIVFVGGNRVTIYWNRAGCFDPSDRTELEAEGNSTLFCVGAIRAEVADIDGDGRNELLIAMREGIEIRRQDDLHRVFQLLPQSYCGWVEAIDLDGDGRPDLLTSRYQDGRTYETESLIFWNGPEGFSPERTTGLSTTGAVGVTAGDLDGDGQPEIIFNNTMGGPSQFDPDFPLYIYLGNEASTYDVGRRIELPTGGSTNTYILADLDHTGYPDLVMTTTTSLRLFPGGPEGPNRGMFYDLPNLGNDYYSVLVGDFNRDGWLDLLAVAYTYDDKPETLARSSVLFYGSAEGFSVERSVLVPTYAGGLGHAADVNNDGWLDFIYGDRRGYIAIYLGGPDGFSEERMWKIPVPEKVAGWVGMINSADLDGNGHLDLIVTILGHYQRQQCGVLILYGGPDGYSKDRMTFHKTAASNVFVCVADVNNDGHLDLLVPAYSTQFSRELPAHIYWGNGKTFDWENPFVIPCNASCSFMAVDITGNGYRDVLAICHRDDLGHQVDSLVFWNGPEGLSLDRVARIPGMGPHLCSTRDFGNGHTREPVERYVSLPHVLSGSRPGSIEWDAEVPEKTGISFELRWADSEAMLEHAPWCGPAGEGSFYEISGTEIQGMPGTPKVLQYRATFFSPDGCRSPKLREVRVGMQA